MVIVVRSVPFSGLARFASFLWGTDLDLPDPPDQLQLSLHSPLRPTQPSGHFLVGVPFQLPHRHAPPMKSTPRSPNNVPPATV